MRIAVLGSGAVARTFATAFVNLGHDVMLGTRDIESSNATEWRDSTGGLLGSPDDAAAFGDIVVNALNGAAALEAISRLNPKPLNGKVFIDAANPLDFSNGFPPFLSVGNTDSLGEQLQRALPDVRVVKALNTVSSALLVDPGSLSEATDLFICGNDGAAKETVTELLVELGWHAERVRDLGDITSARGTEAYLALWTRVMSSLGTATFNVRVVVA